MHGVEPFRWFFCFVDFLVLRDSPRHNARAITQFFIIPNSLYTNKQKPADRSTGLERSGQYHIR